MSVFWWRYRRLPLDWLDQLLLAVFDQLDDTEAYAEQVRAGIVAAWFVDGTPAQPHQLRFGLGECVTRFEDRSAAPTQIEGITVREVASPRRVRIGIDIFGGVVAGMHSDRRLDARRLDLASLDTTATQITVQRGSLEPRLKAWGIRGVDNSALTEVRVAGQDLVCLRTLADGDALAYDGTGFVIVSMAERRALPVPAVHNDRLKTELMALAEAELYAMADAVAKPD